MVAKKYLSRYRSQKKKKKKRKQRSKGECMAEKRGNKIEIQ